MIVNEKPDSDKAVRRAMQVIVIAALLSCAPSLSLSQSEAGSPSNSMASEFQSFADWSASKAGEAAREEVKQRAWSAAVTQVMGPVVDHIQSKPGIGSSVALSSFLSMDPIEPGSTSADRLSNVSLDEILETLGTLDRIANGELADVLKENLLNRFEGAAINAFPILGQIKAGYDALKAAYDYLDAKIYALNVTKINWVYVREQWDVGTCHSYILSAAVGDTGIAVRDFLVSYARSVGDPTTNSDLQGTSGVTGSDRNEEVFSSNNARALVLRLCNEMDRHAKNVKSAGSATALAKKAQVELRKSIVEQAFGENRGKVSQAFDEQRNNLLQAKYNEAKQKFVPAPAPLPVVKPIAPPVEPPSPQKPSPAPPPPKPSDPEVPVTPITPPRKPDPPAPQPAAPEKPLPNCNDVPDGTPCKDDTPTTGPGSPNTCPEGQESIITIDPRTGKGRQTGCRVSEKPSPTQGSGGGGTPSGSPTGGQSAEERKQAEEDAAWAARVAEMDAAAAQEKKRKDDAWKQQQEDWKQFGYQPPDVKIVGPVEQESSWGLVLALNKALRESLSSMYAGLAGRKANIDRMAAEYEKIGSSLAKRLESSGAGSCFDAIQASQALPTKDVSAGKIMLSATDPDELNRRLAAMEKLHSQIAGVKIVSAEELQKKVDALSVAISAYNQELQKPEVRKWLKVINDNREILVKMSQAQVDSGIRPTGLDPAEMPDFGGAACGQAMRQLENINARIRVLRAAVVTRQQLLGLAKPILDRMRQIESQMSAMKSGKLGVREIAAVRGEFATAQGKSSTSTTPGKAFALYERARSGMLTSDVATMIAQSLDLSDRLNQQVTEVTHEAAKKAVVIELEKLIKQIEYRPPTRGMLDSAAELARLGQVGGEPEVQALMLKLSSGYQPSAAEKATAIGPSGPPPGLGSGPLPGTPTGAPRGAPGSSLGAASGSRPAAELSGAATAPAATTAVRDSPLAGSAPTLSAKPAATAKETAPGGAVGDLAAIDAGTRPATQPPGQDIAQIKDLYQKFVQSYQSKNLNGVLRAMTSQWQASDGSGLPDLEDTLRNSFRVFDVIQFRIDGLQVQKAGADTYNVSYAATLSGRINRLNVKHEETSNVQDVVQITPDGPRIVRTKGNVTIKAR